MIHSFAIYVSLITRYVTVSFADCMNIGASQGLSKRLKLLFITVRLQRISIH
jgi:hypothetical protein